MKYQIRFECCDIVTHDQVEATSKHEAVCIWEKPYEEKYGLFFIQNTYEEMVLAAERKDCSLEVKEVQ